MGNLLSHIKSDLTGRSVASTVDSPDGAPQDTIDEWGSLRVDDRGADADNPDRAGAPRRRASARTSRVRPNATQVRPAVPGRRQPRRVYRPPGLSRAGSPARRIPRSRRLADPRPLVG